MGQAALTVKHIAQHVRLVVLDVLVELVEVRLLHPELLIDQKGVGVRLKIMNTLAEQVVVDFLLMPLSYGLYDDHYCHRNDNIIYPIHL